MISSTHLPPAMMARIVRGLRCRVVRVRRWRSAVPGRLGVGYDVECPSHRRKVALLDALAWYDAKVDMALREFALALMRAAGPSLEERARAVHRLVRDGVRFLREPREVFQDAYLTLYYGAGDCDDHARLVLALLRICGVRCRPAVLFKRGMRAKSGEKVPTHIAAKALLFGRWVWCETTLHAEFGEHPLAAKRRLGEDVRHDIA